MHHKIECVSSIRKQPTATNLTCAQCKGVASLQCSGCRQSFYCGGECQAKHWESHKLTCSRTGLSEVSLDKHRSTDTKQPKINPSKVKPIQKRRQSKSNKSKLKHPFTVDSFHDPRKSIPGEWRDWKNGDDVDETRCVALIVWEWVRAQARSTKALTSTVQFKPTAKAV
jgi:hypothetical protein